MPNTQYEFWVSALNAAGISPPSERAVYVTGKNILFIQLCDLHSEIQSPRIVLPAVLSGHFVSPDLSLLTAWEFPTSIWGGP